MSHVTPGKAQPKLTSFFSSPRTATPSPGSGTAPAPQRSLLPEPDGTPPKSLLPDFGTASKSLLPGAETPKRPRDPVPALVSSPGGTPETEVDSPTSKRAKPDPEAPPAALPEPHRAAPTARPPQPPVTAAPTPQPPATRRFVPAPLNASGLLPGEAAAQRGQQLAKEKKEIRYSWLADPRDQQGCRPGDPGYDPRRLYVPPTVLANMTDFERQYWEIKKDNWDVVVFFKKGKFYELYEVDADIGHVQFGLKMTPRVNMRMVGVPESSFATWCKQFIYKGHKVGRVEQMEYRLAKKAGDRSLVQRQLCQIITLGTLTEEEMLLDHRPNYLLAVKEDPSAAAYGVCFVDAARGEFHVARLEDTVHRAELATLLHRTKPKELIIERDNLSKVSLAVLRRELMDPIMNKLTPQDFLDAVAVRQQLVNGNYFGEEGCPAVLKQFWDDDLVMNTVGGCLFYLQRLKLDEELLSMRQVHQYNPSETLSSHLILDGITLANLEVLENSRDKTAAGTLLQHLNHCVTPFGKREFKRWLCNPLRVVSDINNRLDAVEDLMHSPDLRGIIEGLKSLPDLERLVSRVFAGGRDVQQVCWVDVDVASRKQVALFLSTVQGFRAMWSAWERMAPLAADLKSPYLRALCTVAGPGADGRFPDVSETLQFFENSFDRAKAQSEGLIVPNAGVSAEYDAAVKAHAAVERALGDILTRYRDHFQDEKILYRNIGKETHQVEITQTTLSHAKGRLPPEFRRMSETKSVQRFWTDEIEGLARQLKTAQMKIDDVLAGMLREIMHRFGLRMREWVHCVRLAAELDCLRSLAAVSFQDAMCRPQFCEADPSRGAVFEAQGVRHPCVRPAVGSKVTAVVPNDVGIGGAGPLAVLLTGPNMGGKSTVMRSVCVAVIMAQLGCYVCADQCRLSVVDRIFTRIGATDRIMSGQSTFMVELEETSTILNHATQDSLVILDELGRGTSTFDGYAIAYSTLKHIAERIRCRTVFSTHYYFLTEEMARECGDVVAPHHMHYALDPETGEVTFLYRFQSGVCQKSYGIDVARKAGLMTHLLTKAQQLSADFEKHSPLNAYSREKQEAALLQRLHGALTGPAPPADLEALQNAVRQFLADDPNAQ